MNFDPWFGSKNCAQNPKTSEPKRKNTNFLKIMDWKGKEMSKSFLQDHLLPAPIQSTIFF